MLDAPITKYSVARLWSRGDFLGPLLLRGLIYIIASLGLIWGILSVTRGASSDAFFDLEARLLKFETFSSATATTILNSAAAHEVSGCDTHAQRGLMLLEIPLAEAALRSGSVQEFDRRSRSLEARAKRTLSCSPRDSLVWLVLFALQNEHGLLDKHTFDLLAMSYETSPNEAWIAVRRILVAVPVLLAAPEALQQKILAEFQDLVRDHFVEMPARAFLNASPLVRIRLQARIDQLGVGEKAAFAAALSKLNS